MFLDCFVARHMAQTPPLLREDTGSTPLYQASRQGTELAERAGAESTLRLSIIRLLHCSAKVAVCFKKYCLILP